MTFPIFFPQATAPLDHTHQSPPNLSAHNITVTIYLSLSLKSHKKRHVRLVWELFPVSKEGEYFSSSLNFFFLSGFNLRKERLNFLAFSLFGFQDNRGKGKDNPEYPPLRCYFFFVFVYNKKQQQQQKQEGQWLALSFNPENFVPGLVIGFILGLLLDLSKPPKNKTNKKNFAPGKPQFAVSNNSDQELKMVCFALFT